MIKKYLLPVSTIVGVVEFPVVLGDVVDRGMLGGVVYGESVELVILYCIAVCEPFRIDNISNVDVSSGVTGAKPAGNNRPWGKHSGNSNSKCNLTFLTLEWSVFMA